MATWLLGVVFVMAHDVTKFKAIAATDCLSKPYHLDDIELCRSFMWQESSQVLVCVDG